MKKALVYRWKAYNQFDVEEALREADVALTIAELPYVSPDRDEAFEREFERLLQAMEYDFVFSINYFTIIARVCEHCRVIYISWLCDSRLLTMHNQSVFSEYNRIFAFDQMDVAEFRRMGVPVRYLPLAVNIDRLDAVIAHRGEGNGAITFVGSLYAQKNEYDVVKDKLTPYLQGYFDAVLAAQTDVYGEDVVDKLLTPEICEQLERCLHLEKAPESFSDIRLVFAVTHLGFKLAHLERMELLQELSRSFYVRLYSDLAPSGLPRVEYCGTVDYWKEMPLVFRESAVNLNITMRNIRSGLPLRVFDILGSGGFLLTNFQMELGTLFEQEKELVWYESFDDCRRKADYYLNHEQEREAIARAGYEKVRKNHTYRQRIPILLSEVGKI